MSTTIPSNAAPIVGNPDLDRHLTLTAAAKIAPGRPSSNCIWRWCRKGVLARSGERIKLQHVRVGGKLFTSACWVREFGERLAAADAVHFDRREKAAVSACTPSPAEVNRREHLAQVDRELTEAGL